MKLYVKIYTFIAIGLLTWTVTSMNGCGAPMHSVSSSSSASIEGGLELFGKVQTILARDCNSCHQAGGTASNFELANPSAFVAAGLIQPGLPNQSKLVFRLKNHPGGTTNTNNMPLGRNAIPDADYQVLYSWVLEMSQAQSPFQCNQSAVNYATIPGTNAKRLSMRQYRNTLVDLFSNAIGSGAASALISSTVGGVFLPSDSGVNFKRENNQFSADHAQAFFDVADRLSNSLSATHAQAIASYFIRLDQGMCADTNITNLSVVCRNQFVRNLGARAFRRPLRVPENRLSGPNGIIDESAALLAEFNNVTFAQGLNRVLFRLLMSPHFLMQVEDQNLVGASVQNSNVYTLNSFAIANRLSYRFWNTMPDEGLWSLALREDLSTDEGYLRALNYVVSQTSKLNDSLREYYNEWLKLDRTPQFNVNSRFALVANNVQFNSTLRNEMISEIEELGSYVTLNNQTFESLFTSDVSLARSTNLMNIYGLTTPAPANVTPTNAVRFPAGQRAGILTRAAFLTSGSEFASPIMRGYHVRKEILCLNLGAPPANALDQFNNTQVPNELSTREKVHIKTSGPNCVGCHSVINPLGFALSNYNSFGSYITQEPIFSQTSNAISTTVPVSSAVDLSSLFGSGVQAQNGIDYSRMIAQQQSARVCFAEKYMSYSFGRTVDRTRDACRLERIYNNLDNSGRLIDIIRSSAMDSEFRLRKVDP